MDQIVITSGGVQAVCAAVALIGAANVFAIRAIVQQAIRDLNGRYMYAQGSKLTGHEVEARLSSQDRATERLQDDLNKLHEYAHRRTHELANKLQRIQ
jgi:hypothetical protein